MIFVKMFVIRFVFQFGTYAGQLTNDPAVVQCLKVNAPSLLYFLLIP